MTEEIDVAIEAEQRARRGPTLKEYAEEIYLPWLQKRKAYTTYINKEKHMRLHIFPLLGDMPIREVASPEAVGRLFEYLDQATYKRKGEDQPLCRNYRNRVLLTLSALLRHGSSPKTCKPPVCDPHSVEMFPEDEGSLDHGTYEGYVLGVNRGKALPLDKVIRLLEATKEIKDPDYGEYVADYYYVLVGFGLYAGCRIGEAAARKWEDIDWDEGMLRLDTQIRRDNTEGPTKNKISGYVELAPEMLSALRRLQKHSTGRYILGGRRGPHGGGKGLPYLSSQTLGDRYKKLYQVAFGVAKGKYHALRHRFATSLVDSGTPIHEVKALCRHKKIATTYLYVAGNTARQRAASRALSFQPSLRVVEGGMRTG